MKHTFCKNNHRVSYLFVIFLFAINIFLLILNYQNRIKTEESVQQTVAKSESISGSHPKPTPIQKRIKSQLPVPKGKLEWSINSNTDGPKMGDTYLDPTERIKGKKQTMGVSAQDTLPIQSVVLTVSTDNKKNTYPMSLVKGDTQSGLWEATWTVNDSDTIDYNYTLTLEAISENGKTKVDITIR